MRISDWSSDVCSSDLATFLGGKNFNDDRTNVMGFVGYYHRDALDASSKDFTQTADLRERAGSDDTRWDNRSLSGPYGNFTTGTANPDGSFTPGGFGRFHTQRSEEHTSELQSLMRTSYAV